MISVCCLETGKVNEFLEPCENGCGRWTFAWLLDEKWDITPTLVSEAILMKDFMKEEANFPLSYGRPKQHSTS